jgi:hypothetical protein
MGRAVCIYQTFVRIQSGADGALWFTNATDGSINRVTTGGVFTATYTLPSTANLPGRLTTGPDGTLWFIDQTTTQETNRTDAGQSLVGDGPDMPMEVFSSGTSDLDQLVMFVLNATRLASVPASLTEGHVALWPNASFPCDAMVSARGWAGSAGTRRA